MSTRIHFLASGSDGNSVVVEFNRTRVMVDCGLPERPMRKLMSAAGMAPEVISSLLITHEHGDHSSGGTWLHNKCGVTCYASQLTATKLSYRCQAFKPGDAFRIAGNVRVVSFSVPHDAVEPVGYTLECNGEKVGVLADCGHVTREMVERLRGCHVLVVEANHDERMESQSGRHPELVKRILGPKGHLSNRATAELVNAVQWEGLQHVVLAHLSSECNSPELARAAVRPKCGKATVSIANEIEWVEL